MNKALANLLIISGLSILLVFCVHFYQINNPNRLKIENSANLKIENSKEIYPLSLEIKDLDISLPVIPTVYDGKNWNTTSDGVSYIGNNIFYGHNWKSILGNLTHSKIGQKISVYFSDKTIKIYEIVEIKIVEPNNTNILSVANNKTLIIYTCTGFFDSKRFVVIAK